MCRHTQSLELSISGYAGPQLGSYLTGRLTVFHDLLLFTDSVATETLWSQPRTLMWRPCHARDREGNIKLWRYGHALWGSDPVWLPGLAWSLPPVPKDHSAGFTFFAFSHNWNRVIACSHFCYPAPPLEFQLHEDKDLCVVHHQDLARGQAHRRCSIHAQRCSISHLSSKWENKWTNQLTDTLLQPWLL